MTNLRLYARESHPISPPKVSCINSENKILSNSWYTLGHSQIILQYSTGLIVNLNVGMIPYRCQRPTTVIVLLVTLGSLVKVRDCWTLKCRRPNLYCYIELTHICKDVVSLIDISASWKTFTFKKLMFSGSTVCFFLCYINIISW